MSESTINQFGIEVDSAAMFECLNRYIGNEKEIELRRRSFKMLDMIMSNQHLRYSYSGSYAEGFHFMSSDRDIMIWNNKTKAVCDINQINIQNETNALLMDTRRCRPGFSLLKVLTYTDDDILQECVTFRDNTPYIDASKYRNSFLSLDDTQRIHGPSCTVTTNLCDFDCVHCINCDYWPTQASEFITRCTRHQWPSVSVLDEIVRNGCHLVPVGARYSETENLEWRISFSMVEKKLIFTFNHTQFLCYGLLKLVLSEVINKETTVSDLLCSYFLKTAVFWEIQLHNPTSWQPGNILTCFWNCFDRLISWASSDYCPNFFIPENNMFSGKFTVKQQRDLVKYLQILRNEGTGLFYRIPNLMCVQITDVISPMSSMCTRYLEYILISIDIKIGVHDKSSDKLRSLFVKCLSYKQQNKALAHAVVLDITLDHIVTTLLLRDVNDFVNSTEIKNKERYKTYRSRLCPYMRYLSSSSPCSRLYLATVLYTLGQYNTVLDIVTNVQTKIHPVNSGYSILLDDPELRKHLCLYLVFINDNEVNKLPLELQSLLEPRRGLGIPPLLYIKWLIFMCHHHIKNKYKCKQALEDLHVLLFDDGLIIDDASKDLTYNMVGMCYELYGDYQNALLMYRTSMEIGGDRCTAAALRLERLENRLTISS